MLWFEAKVKSKLLSLILRVMFKYIFSGYGLRLTFKAKEKFYF